MLGKDEIRHIFPEDEVDDIQCEDIVSALWVPNGQYYDAKVLQKGGQLAFFLQYNVINNMQHHSATSLDAW